MCTHQFLNELNGTSIILMKWIAFSGCLEKKLNVRSSHRVFSNLVFNEVFFVDFKKWSKKGNYDSIKKILLCIYSRVLCLSLAKISKIWFSVLLEIAVVNWILLLHSKLTTPNIKVFGGPQFLLIPHTER